jgi:hypothetical protein
MDTPVIKTTMIRPARIGNWKKKRETFSQQEKFRTADQHTNSKRNQKPLKQLEPLRNSILASDNRSTPIASRSVRKPRNNNKNHGNSGKPKKRSNTKTKTKRKPRIHQKGEASAAIVLYGASSMPKNVICKAYIYPRLSIQHNQNQTQTK